MAQQSILGRITQLARANINALIDSAEDPEKMLDQMVRDYTNSIAEAEEAVAQSIGNLRMMEADQREAVEAAGDWGNKAAAAANKAEELRAAGSTAEADSSTTWRGSPSSGRSTSRARPRTSGASIAQQIGRGREAEDRPQHDGRQARGAQAKRDELVARAKMAEAQTKVHDALKSVDINDPTERDQPLRGQGPPRGGQGRRPGRAGGLVPGRAVREPRRPRRGRRGRGAPRGAQQAGGRRLPERVLVR